MPHTYYVFTNVAEPRIGLAHDTGWSAIAVPGTDPQGRQGWVFTVPDTVPDGQGAQVNLDAAGKTPIQFRGVLTYATSDPTRAFMQCDDFPMADVPAPPEQPPPPPVTGSTPLEIIQGVHNSGNYNLATKPGCGTFTEECCRQLAAAFGPQWGHVAKSPGQNQYNNHAIDALYALYGSDAGVWDIITSSVSTSAKPAFNDAGEGNPEEWRPPAPLPVQPVTTTLMTLNEVQVTFTGSAEALARLLALIKVA